MKKKYQIAAWCITGLFLLGMTGCGGSAKNEMAAGGTFYDSSTTESIMMDAAAPAEAPEAAEEGQYDAGSITSGEGIDTLAQNGRKLIRTVRLEMQTKEFDALTSGIRNKVQEMNGYIESSSVWGNSYSGGNTRSSDYTVRIPQDRLDEFIDVVSGLGNVTYKNESVEDVTLQYVDVESRQKALETEQDRLMELLEQADNLEDLLTIESRLSEVRYELENYGSQKRVLDNQINYSTVYITVSEVERITPVGEKSFLEEIADRFSASLYNVGRGFRGFFIVLIGSLPVLAVWAAVIAVLVLALRKIFNGKKKEEKPKKEKKNRWFGRKPEDDQ